MAAIFPPASYFRPIDQVTQYETTVGALRRMLHSPEIMPGLPDEAPVEVTDKRRRGEWEIEYRALPYVPAIKLPYTH